MAKLKTLDPKVKKAFTDAGISLTPEQEHVAAEAAATGFDWIGLITKLTTMAAQIIPVIIAIFGSKQPAKAVAAGCCNHHDCCCKCLHDALKTVQDISDHLCQCCCE